METETVKREAKSKLYRFGPIAIGIAGTVAAASADIAGDMTNISTVITSLTGWVTDLMTLFMQPPLVYFVAIGFFLVGFRLVRGILIRRR